MVLTNPSRHLVRRTSRRMFLKKAVSSTALLLAEETVFRLRPLAADSERRFQVCLFSKPLEKLGYDALAEFGAELGIGGIDLTVRTPGHVSPERVAEDLPKALRAFEASGLSVPMITTAIVDARDSSTEAIIRTAADLRIPFLKLGYFRYQGLTQIERELSQVRQQVRAIAELCEQHKIQAGFHNHSGIYVGAAMWDVWEILRDLPAQWVGSYFDPAHATVEGGEAGWKIGLNLLLPRLKMLAIKDFRWERVGSKTKSEVVFGPLGNGEVSWKEVFATLRNSDFTGPISLHIEYTALREGTRSEKERMLKVVRQDLAFLKESLQAATV